MQQATSVGARTFNILLAEDDPAMLELLALSLGQDGHKVVTARDGTTLVHLLGVLCLGGETPDLIVTDIHMPGLGGLDVLEAARRHERVPVIVITAFGDAELHARARRLGALAVFDKPFDPDDLKTLIQDLTSRKRGAQP